MTVEEAKVQLERFVHPRGWTVEALGTDGCFRITTSRKVVYVNYYPHTQQFEWGRQRRQGAARILNLIDAFANGARP